MKKILIGYYTTSGNTEQMAELIKQGAVAEGASVECKNIADISESDIDSAEVFALGCSACGTEEISEEMESFIESIEDKISGKTVALFGSYDWGDGEWIRVWAEKMENLNANVVGVEDAIYQGYPDDEQIFLDLGASIAK